MANVLDNLLAIFILLFFMLLIYARMKNISLSDAVKEVIALVKGK